MTLREGEPGKVEVVRPHGGTASDQIRAIRTLSRAGYSRVWLSEVAAFDAIALAGRVRGEVPDLALTIGPLAAPLRSAPQLAMVASALAETPGDLELVLGASSPRITQDWHGRQQARVATVRALFETYGVITEGGRTSREESFGTSDGFVLRAALPYRVPLGLAASGPRMRALAASHADRLVLNFSSAALVDSHLRELGATATSAEHQPRVTAWLHVAPGDRESRAASRKFLARYVRVPGYREAFRAQGFGDLIDRVVDVDDYAAVVSMIPDELVDAMVHPIAGPHLRKTVADYIDHGVDVALTTPVPGLAQGLATLTTAAQNLALSLSGRAEQGD